jgi:hypothetical protein
MGLDVRKALVLLAIGLIAGLLVGYALLGALAGRTVSLSESVGAGDRFGAPGAGIALAVNVYVYKNGELVAVAHNLITNNGIGLLDEALHGSDNAPARARFIALSTDGTAPSYTDTSCPSEITSGGLQRAEGLVTVTAGPANGDETVRVSKTFTATAAFTGVQKACMFTDITGGTLFAVATFSAVNLQPNDQLTINWDFSYTN